MWPDGKRSTEFPDGQRDTKWPDGKEETVLSSGQRQTIEPDGTEVRPPIALVPPAAASGSSLPSF